MNSILQIHNKYITKFYLILLKLILNYHNVRCDLKIGKTFFMCICVCMYVCMCVYLFILVFLGYIYFRLINLHKTKSKEFTLIY